MLKKHFFNTRARVQRIRDAKLFSGWVRSFSGTTLVATLSREAQVTPGETFVFQVQGPGSVAMFTAVLELAFGMELTLNLISEVKFVKSDGTMRLLVEGMTGQLIYENYEIDVTILDLSENGAGVVTDEALEKGTGIQLVIDSPQGRVDCSGEVIYCRRLEVGNQYRIGMSIKPQNRVDTARWQRLLQAEAA
jgi:PilZ domain